MRVIIASTMVPFVQGGARFIVEWLETKLRDAGHEVERFYLPFDDSPELLLQQAAALRLMDLSGSADRLIAIRPPAHLIRHPHKIVWFIHHIRIFYDLWESEYGPEKTPANLALREALWRLDGVGLSEARRIFTNSQVVADRVQRFNALSAEPLYPPLFAPERFRNEGYGDEIVVVCRMEPHKRQHLLLEALARTFTPVKLRLCGRSASEEYRVRLRALIAAFDLEEKVILDDRWISEAEKADALAGALAVAYAPLDEDSYGYPSLEGAHAGKAVITTTDSGGVLELVRDGDNGFVCPPDPAALALRFDQLYRDRKRAETMGARNRARLSELRIDWDRVVEAFTT